MSIEDLKKVTDEIIRRRDEYKKERDKYKKALEDIAHVDFYSYERERAREALG